MLRRQQAALWRGFQAIGLPAPGGTHRLDKAGGGRDHVDVEGQELQADWAAGWRFVSRVDQSAVIRLQACLVAADSKALAEGAQAQAASRGLC